MNGDGIGIMDPYFFISLLSSMLSFVVKSIIAIQMDYNFRV